MRALRGLTALALLCGALSCGRAPAREPRLVLWSWERADDLRFVPPGVTVAFLAGTVELRAGASAFVPRRQPLRLAPEGPRVAVVRLQPFGDRHLALAEVDEVAGLVLRGFGLPRAEELQLDFDARESERPAARALLQALRSRLPPAARLSATGLASWCLDGWADTLPVDALVPQLFRLGSERLAVLSAFREGRALARSCRKARGTSLDEPDALGAAALADTLYVFSPSPWTPAALAALRARVTSWSSP